MSAFSDFIRNATPDEKREVYEKVMSAAVIEQKRFMGIPTGEQVVKFYNDQPSDKLDRKTLEQMIDNAVGITMRVCWGINK